MNAQGVMAHVATNHVVRRKLAPKAAATTHAALAVTCVAHDPKDAAPKARALNGRHKHRASPSTPKPNPAATPRSVPSLQHCLTKGQKTPHLKVSHAQTGHHAGVARHATLTAQKTA